MRCRFVLNLSCLGAIACAAPALAQTPASYLQYSSIVGTGQTLSALRVPVTTSAGKTIYQDVTIGLAVGADGTITYATAEPTVTASPMVLSTTIMPGNYVDTSNSSNGFTVAGPGIPFGGGYSIYTVFLTTGKSCAVGAPSNIYTGPVAATPLAKRVAAAKINTTGYVFGLAGTELFCLSGNPQWPSEGLLGFSETNGAITVTSFSTSTSNGTVDHAMPVASDVLVLTK